MRERAAVLVALGEPGAGKTTLVRRLARHARARGERPAIVLCELGRASIDATTLRSEGETVVEVSGGYPCCGRSRELESAIARLAADVVLVEAPAGSDAGAVLASAGAGARLVVVADAQRLEAALASPGPLARADLVLLNKVDTRFDEEIAGLVAALKSRTNGAPVVPTVESALELSELPPPGLFGPGTSARGLHGHEEVSVVEIELASGLRRADVERLTGDPPRGLSRAKGFLRLEDEEGLFALQITGRSGALRRCWIEPAPAERLAFVGAGIDEAAMRARLR